MNAMLWSVNRCAGLPAGSGGVESARAYRGIGASVLELEMWRCAVRPDLAGSAQQSGVTAGANQGSTQFELVRSSVGNRWQLLRVYS